MERRGARIALLYPFSKRFVSMPQAVLGVAFSFGIRWRSRRCAATCLAGCGLLIGNLFWVLAYDTEYAMVDRDDDLKIGIQTSAITLGRFDVAAVMAFYAIFLAIWAAIGMQARTRQRRTTSASAWPRCRRPGTTR
jgi:4-hydroxybenzoate polyprenyltransferase